MKKSLLILFTIIQTYSFSQDTTKTSFSLKEAQDYAVANNLNLLNAKLDIKIAKAKILETTAIGLPQVKANLGHNYMIDIPVTLLPAQIFNPMAPEGQMMPVKFGTDHNSSAEIQVSQLIFSGEYIVGLKASKIYKQLSETQYTKTEQDVKDIISSTYQLILVAQERTAILQKNIESTQSIFNDTKEMFKAGFAQETDVSQMQINLSRLNNAFESAKRQIEIGKKLLKFQMNIPLDKNIELTEKLESFISQLDYNSISNLALDQSNHIDYKIIEVQENLQKLNLQREKSTFLPSIAAFYSNKQTLQSNDFEVFTGGTWYKSNIVGLSVQIPIFGSGQKLSRVSQAKIGLDKVQNAKLMISSNLNMQMITAKNDIQNAFDTYNLEKENKELTQKIYDNYKTKYNSGLATSMEFTQAQMQYLSTEDAYFQAVFKLLDAKTKLEKALGIYK